MVGASVVMLIEIGSFRNRERGIYEWLLLAEGRIGTRRQWLVHYHGPRRLP